LKTEKKNPVQNCLKTICQLRLKENWSSMEIKTCSPGSSLTVQAFYQMV